MITDVDIPRDLIARIGKLHDANPGARRDFTGPNGLVLATKPGWAVEPDGSSRETNIDKAIRDLRRAGNASLRVGGGKFFIFISVK